MGAERAGLLHAALDDDAAALDTLLSACGVEIPIAAYDHVRSRVAGWLRSVREKGNDDDGEGGSLTMDDLQWVVRSNVRDAGIRRLLAENRFEEVHRLVQRELGGMVRARVLLNAREDIMQQAWLEALRSYDPDKGALIPLLRTIVRTLAPRFWSEPYLALEDIPEPKVEAAVPPSSECFEALLSIVVRDEPHKAVVFVLSQVMGAPPREIDSEFGEMPLGVVVDIVERRYFDGGWNSPGVRRCFRMLRDRLVFPLSETTLRSHYTRGPQRSLPAWTNDVWKKLRRTLVNMQADFLRLVFSLHFDPHKTLTYAYLGLLCWAPRDLWSSSDAVLYELRDRFPEHYPPEELDGKSLAKCLAPLNRELDRPRLSPAGRSTLAQSAGEQMMAALSVWRWEVNRTVCRKAGEEGLCAIAYINGAVERKRPSTRRMEAAR